jgi:hypothetical protein
MLTVWRKEMALYLVRKAARVAGGCFVFCGLLCGAQSMATQVQMHARIVALYNFHPAKLTDAQRQAKSAEMDAFWTAVKTDPAHLLPMLRTELRDTSDPAFFMTDGSGLLLELSKAAPDKDLALAAMSRSDLADVDNGHYYYEIHDLSVEGFDTTAAALHILDDPTFTVPVPAHAMMLDQSMSLVYLLLPVDADKWMPAAQRRFETEKNETAQKSLLMLFFYLQTSDGDRLIAAAANDSARPEAIRKDAKRYIDDENNAIKEKAEVKGTESTIRADRKKRLRAVSDEAIDDVNDMTLRLAQLHHPAK